MIFDRTQNDVEQAGRLVLDKVQFFSALTESETELLERGALTVSTLNRIETTCEQLHTTLKKMGYFNHDFETKTWRNNDDFRISDMKRMINGAEMLKKAFFVYPETPERPQVTCHFTTFNDLEKILYDLLEMVDEVKSNYRECGTFSCGEE